MPYVVSKRDIFYNDKLTVINDIVILNDENHTILKPVRYFGDKMQVEARKDRSSVFRWVTLKEGLTDEYSTNVYFDGSRSPYWKDAMMTNAATGKMEYLSPEWVEREEKRRAFEELRGELSRSRSSWVISDEMVRSHLERKHK